MKRPKKEFHKPIDEDVAELLVDRMLDFTDFEEIEREFAEMRKKAKTPAARLSVARLENALYRYWFRRSAFD
jgi:hypothetical protein